jgi:hypothetical protein
MGPAVGLRATFLAEALDFIKEAALEARFVLVLPPSPTALSWSAPRLRGRP